MSLKSLLFAISAIFCLASSSSALEVQVFWRGSSLAALAGGSAIGEVPIGSSVSSAPGPEAIVDGGATYNSGTSTFTIPQNGYIVFAFDVITPFNLSNFTIRTTAVSQSTSFKLVQNDPDPLVGVTIASPSGLSAGYNNITFAPVTIPAGQGQSIFLVNTSPQSLIFSTATNFTPVFVVPEPSTTALSLLATIAVAGLTRQRMTNAR